MCIPSTLSFVAQILDKIFYSSMLEHEGKSRIGHT